MKHSTKNGLTRREFLWVTSASAAGLLLGCATNPVTGRSQLMLVSEDQEIEVDRQNSPHQFSTDYGLLQDRVLNNYINTTGKKISTLTHRPHMPYSFQGVNAAYVNAYAFPGGSIVTTRGILVELKNEAELAALLGHEIGHVNARHTAEQISKGKLTNALIGGIATVAGTQSSGLGSLTSQLGMLGAGALLAHYSRSNEREADALGLEYMVKAGYSPNGFVGLMDMLRSTSKHKPGAIELMFSTHPMSDERYRTAVQSVQTQFPHAQNLPLYQERYMDNTAKLRSMKGAIEDMQKGELAMGGEKYDEAETYFKKALKQAPEDYTGLVMMAKCLTVREKYSEAAGFVGKAKQVYPQEAQSHYLAGFVNIKEKKYDSAYEDFNTYEKVLPGNPNIKFYQGLSLEGMKRVPESANKYYEYIKIVNQGEKAKYAYQRLVEWGYVK